MLNKSIDGPQNEQIDIGHRHYEDKKYRPKIRSLNKTNNGNNNHHRNRNQWHARQYPPQALHFFNCGALACNVSLDAKCNYQIHQKPKDYLIIHL